LRRLLKYAALLWVARWLGREIAARLGNRQRVVE
jgi:hypothetical protein